MADSAFARHHAAAAAAQVPAHFRLQPQASHHAHHPLDAFDGDLAVGVQVQVQAQVAGDVDFASYAAASQHGFDASAHAHAHAHAHHGLPAPVAAVDPSPASVTSGGSSHAQAAGGVPGHFGALSPPPAPSTLQAVDEDEAFAESAEPAVEGDPGGGEQRADAGAGAGPGEGETRPHGTLSTKVVVDPPQLAEWRARLFNVDEMMILSHEEFETYFPHIDNVYSHRSTQKYKRKPFISHYWDCRMKGRPPGTPKSDNPNKKKRKRIQRERDLCDVKIKITEYFDGASLNMLDVGAAPSSTPFTGPGTDGERFWTMQRVNGNGGNGKGDGIAGPHKHSLERSDEIKKSSVQRWLATQNRETRKTPKVPLRKPTGVAAATVRKHAKASDMKLYAACFCPFSQRVWIALEAKGLPYQYCEIDPFKKPTQLLEANPRGLVPAIRKGDWACGESAVILEYLEDLDSRVRLYPTEPRLRAICRLWIDHINSRVVPSFYYLLHSTDAEKQKEGIERLQRDVMTLVNAADERGPYFLGPELCLVDVHLAPFALRLSRVLAPFRRWADTSSSSSLLPNARWRQWVEAVERNAHVRATTSAADLYLETFDSLLGSRPLHLDSGAS